MTTPHLATCLGTRPRRRLHAVLAAVALIIVLAVSPQAEAVAPAIVGWWADAGPVGGSLGPDVPGGGLLVQAASDPEEPTAYGALLYTFDTEETASTLTLTVAPDAVSTPDVGLTVCPLSVATFEATHGGAVEEGPAFACASSVTAAPTDGSYVFDVSGVGAPGTLAVAVVPDAATSRVVIAPPDGESLQTATGSGGVPVVGGNFPAPDANFSPPSGSPAGGSDAIGSTAPSSGSSAPSFSDSTPRSNTTVDLPGNVPGLGTDDDATDSSSESAQGPTPASADLGAVPAATDDGGGVSTAGMAALGLGTLAVAAWMFASRSASTTPAVAEVQTEG